MSPKRVPPLTNVGPAADGYLDGIAAEEQAPAANDLGPSEGSQSDPHQGAVSHLSTRSVIRNDGNLYMVIRRQKISMRMSDYCLNATDICAAAGLNKQARDMYFDRLKSRGVLFTEGRRWWVQFQDGVFLSGAVNLLDEMKPLLSHARVSLPTQGNYLLQERRPPPQGYEFLEWRGIFIAYMPSARMVNATHLLKVCNERRDLRTFLSKNPHIQTTVQKRVAPKVRGTYIGFKDAVQLCQFLNLSSDLIGKMAGTDIIEHSEDGDISNTDEGHGAVFHGSPSSWYNDLAQDQTPYAEHSEGHGDGRDQDTAFHGSPSSWQHSCREYEPATCANDDPVQTVVHEIHEDGEDLSDPCHPTEVAYIPRVNSSQYSQYTESNGSYLAPASQSHEQFALKHKIDLTAVDPAEGRREGEWESPWTESEARLAEALLFGT